MNKTSKKSQKETEFIQFSTDLNEQVNQCNIVSRSGLAVQSKQRAGLDMYVGICRSPGGIKKYKNFFGASHEEVRSKAQEWEANCESAK